MVQGQPHVKRFQISFNTNEEFQHFVMFLHQFKFNIKDDSTESSTTTTTTTNFVQPSSQFTVRPTTLVPTFNETYNQNIFSQPTQAPVMELPMRQPIFAEPNNEQVLEKPENDVPSDFLSQILKPKKKDIDDLSDSELKTMLNEKLHDMKFINFLSILQRTICKY